MQGTVISLDALHVMNETFELAVEDKGAHILVGVKNNREKLLETVKTQLNNAMRKDVFKYTDIDKGHGRVETRSIELTAITPEKAGFSHIHSVMRILRIREHVRNSKVMKTDKETSFYVATFDAKSVGAKRANELIRGHWSIENRLHHSKDVSMNEDRYRAKGGLARIMTTIRSFATIVLKFFGLTVPIAQMRFATKTSFFNKFLKSKSLESFKLCFLG
jgi:predicted transposase YbfD/YdcC